VEYKEYLENTFIRAIRKHGIQPVNCWFLQELYSACSHGWQTVPASRNKHTNLSIVRNAAFLTVYKYPTLRLPEEWDWKQRRILLSDFQNLNAADLGVLIRALR
jgi:hypothetical protein